ncbi:hypothetical protein S83_047063 [Arachis hypogaea]
MANRFSLSVILFFLATSSALMVMVASDQCKQDNGDCTADCNNRCAAAVSGSQGLCGPGQGGLNRCWCYYECQIKMCNENFRMSDNCEDDKCTLACINKHPGRAAQGRCPLVIPPQVTDFCSCTFLCSAIAKKFLP